jgi:predicted nucleic acid-binding protein
MVLVDTSVWIDFLRQGNQLLEDLLNDGEVATHSLVIGELHGGNIAKRKQFLSLLDNLPRIGECSHEEVLFLIEKQKLFGKGIGYFDAQIVCSSIVHETPLWTLDKRLDKIARALTLPT